ncbi:hypothetical protein LINPERHAP2_LOCUS1446 [Linum perenne]
MLLPAGLSAIPRDATCWLSLPILAHARSCELN